MNESVLDKPKDDLDKSVWNKNPDGKYVLTKEAEEKINNICSWLISILGDGEFSLRITGSITSNQYSENSDVDLHFSSSKINNEKKDEFNKFIREKFKNHFQLQNPELVTIGSHPIEIYYQDNVNQDLMSIGCYDFLKKEWLVGPEFLEQNYDPYSEFYEEDMKYVNSIIEDIRNVILETYEILIVLQNSSDENFKELEKQRLEDKFAKAANIFTNARKFRTVFSSPKNEEEAKTNRISRKWKIADSAFKLLDKFGYLGILREMTKSWEDISSGQKTIEETIPNVIQVIQNNIMQNPELQNVDKEMFESVGNHNESFGKTMSLFALIASIITPFVVDAKGLEQDLKSIPKHELRIGSDSVKKAIEKNSVENKTYGNWTYANMTNALAMTLYDEGMTDYVKTKNFDGIYAIANTIQTRAAGMPEHFMDAILEPSQYFGTKNLKWKKGTNKKTNENYILGYPGIGYNKKVWNKCNEIAVEMVKGTAKNVIGDRNMIANKEIDNSSAYNSWGKKCDKKVGTQYYGYDKTHDGYLKYGVKKPANLNHNPVEKPHYIVKSGDNLSTIAKNHKMTLSQILDKNPSLKTNPNNLKIGQKIFI